MNKIGYEQRAVVYDCALVKYGSIAQTVVAIEEMAEVQKELCKLLRGKPDKAHLAEEIADATIMLEQMRKMYGINDEVCRFMDEKIERLERTIKDGADSE